MTSIELGSNQIIRKGKYPAPNLEGYNSLFFHHLTSNNDTSILNNWGKELTLICKNNNLTYYHFFNDFGTKINVYSNELIEDWWNNRN